MDKINLSVSLEAALSDPRELYNRTSHFKENDLRKDSALCVNCAAAACFCGDMDSARRLVQLIDDVDIRNIAELIISSDDTKLNDAVKKITDSFSYHDFPVTGGKPSVINGIRDITEFAGDITSHREDMLKTFESIYEYDNGAIYRTAYAEVCYQRNQCYDALIQVVSAIPLLEKSDNTEVLFSALYTQMCIMIVTGQLSSVHPMINSIGNRINNNSSVLLKRNYEALKAWCAMYDDDWSIVEKWLTRSAPDEYGDVVLTDVFRYMIKARIYLLQEKYIAAIALIEAVRPLLKTTHRVMDMCEADILYALAGFGCGRKDDAFAALDRAFEISRERRFDRLFADEGEQMYIMLKEYTFCRETDKYVQSILKLSKKMALLYPRYMHHHKLDYPELTESENEVLILIADGRTNNEIAEFMGISVNTVKYHLKNLFKKLGAKTRVQAVRIARDEKYI